jgi:hypothetical protein
MGWKGREGGKDGCGQEGREGRVRESYARVRPLSQILNTPLDGRLDSPELK